MYKHDEVILTNIKPVHESIYKKYRVEFKWWTDSEVIWCGCCKQEWIRFRNRAPIMRPCCEKKLQEERKKEITDEDFENYLDYIDARKHQNYKDQCQDAEREARDLNREKFNPKE